ncbi:MAG TPA: EboA domain-containing protein [Azospirillum sp.]|nr:EboA domain-containing protein [Azospirillum sp.]
MPKPYHPIDTQHVLMLLRQWLKAVAPPEGVDWLDRVRDMLNDAAPDAFFFHAFALAPKLVGTGPLRLRPDDHAEAERARAGWRPALWTADQAARTTLLLVYDDSDPVAYGDMLAHVLRAGDRTKAATLYRALPLLPYPERHVHWAQEALRSDDRTLFEALALFNPYPAEFFDETCWNRMILKAAFLGVPVADIAGLERRANTVLAHELRDFARQLYDGGRRVPVGMWQAAGDKVANHVVDDLAAMLNGPDVDMAMAAALALARSRDPRAGEALAACPELADAVRSGRLTWDRLSAGSPSLRAVG